MANEFKITDVVGDEAFTQLGKLKTELKETTTLYSSLVVNIARASKSNPKTFEELSDKAKNFKSSVEKLNSTQEKMNLIQTRQLAILRQVSQQLNSMSSLSKLNVLFEQFAKNVKNASDMLQSLSSTSNNVAASQDNAAKSTQNASNTINQASVQLQSANVNYATIIDTIQSYDSAVTKLTADTISNKEEINKINSGIKALSKEYNAGKISLTEYTQQASLLKQRHIELMAQNQQNTALIKNHSTAIISASGSYYEMNAAMLELQKRYKALTNEQRNSPMGESLIIQANALNNKLKEIDAKFGNYQRNVGNYASAWNGLNVQTQQLLRELPSLTMSFNQFFLAISNNLPMFADELKRANEEFKRMKAEGQTAIPVWKQLLGSLFSWQSALVIGITLLSAYGSEIASWVSGLFKAKDALNKTSIEINALNKASKEGIKNAQSEVNHLKFLYKAAIDENRSRKERQISINEMRKIYPEYLRNMSDENIMAGKANDMYIKLSKSIIEASIAKSKMAEIDSLSTKAWDLSMKAAGKLMEIRKAETETDYVDPFSGEIIKSADRVAHLKKEYEGLTKELRDVYSAQIAISKGIKISDYIEGDDEDKFKKYAEYIKKITEDLEKSRIDIIADGRKREIAEIEKDYNDRIKAIKGNSAKEIELRTNLETLKGEAVAEINDKYDKELLEIEKNNLENRLDSLGENSERELNDRLNIQLKLNDMMRDAEIKNAEKSGEDVSAIIDKYGERQNGIIMQNLQIRFGLIEDATDRTIDRQETASIEEYNILKSQYAKGKISREDYEEKLYEVGVKYAKARLQTMVKEVQAEMALLDPESDKYADLEDRLANIQAQIDNVNFDEAIHKSDKAKEKFKEALSDMNSAARDALGDAAGIFEGLSTVINDLAEDGKLSFKSLLKNIRQIMDGITSLMSDVYDAKIERIEEEQDANDEAYDREIERIEALNENGAISTEEAEARKRAAEDKTQRKNAELEKQKQAIQQKQAKWEKANSIIQTTIATAQAIMKAYAMTGPIAGAIFSAIIGAMGAAQIAIIASQQIPKYAKGTKDHPGGLAIVGDGGKKEGVITEKGLFVTPDKPTLVDLPKHAQVMPDLSFIYDRKGLGSDFLLLEQQKKNMADKGIIVNVDNDYSRLEKKMEGNTKQLQDLNKLMKKANRNAEFNWISKRV
jgi:chromosome segregation ATPase